MRTVDEIMRDAAADSAESAESAITLPRYSRTRNIDCVRSLSKVNGYRTTAYLAIQWIVLIAAFAAAGYSGHWLVYILASFVIASRLQALTIIVHDGAHYLLYKNRTTNDVVSDLFAAFPLGMSTSLFRKTHLRHHRHTNTEEDQDKAAHEQDHEWHAWPKTRFAFVVTMIRSLLGFNAHRGWVLYKHWVPWKNFRSPDFPRRARILYIISMVCVYSFFAIGIKLNPRVAISLMILYAVSGMTTLNIIGRIRATAEHFGTAGTHELNSTRTVVPKLWERLTLAPYGVSYHLEHHLFPSVPGCKLHELHHELMKDDEYRNQAHVTNGYLGMFGELMADSTTDSDASRNEETNAS